MGTCGSKQQQKTENPTNLNAVSTNKQTPNQPSSNSQGNGPSFQPEKSPYQELISG
jgi:hypothetical protein